MSDIELNFGDYVMDWRKGLYGRVLFTDGDDVWWMYLSVGTPTFAEVLKERFKLLDLDEVPPKFTSPPVTVGSTVCVNGWEENVGIVRDIDAVGSLKVVIKTDDGSSIAEVSVQPHNVFAIPIVQNDEHCIEPDNVVKSEQSVQPISTVNMSLKFGDYVQHCESGEIGRVLGANHDYVQCMFMNDDAPIFSWVARCLVTKIEHYGVFQKYVSPKATVGSSACVDGFGGRIGVVRHIKSDGSMFLLMKPHNGDGIRDIEAQTHEVFIIPNIQPTEASTIDNEMNKVGSQSDQQTITVEMSFGAARTFTPMFETIMSVNVGTSGELHIRAVEGNFIFASGQWHNVTY